MQTNQAEFKAKTNHSISSKSDDFIGFLSGYGTELKYSNAAWKAIEPELGSVLDSFYKHVLNYPELSEKLGKDGQKLAGIRSAQAKHWEFILTRDPDAEFERHSIKVGEAHVRADLDVQWYVASYGRILQDLIPLIISKNKLAPMKASRLLQATVSRFFTDMVMSIGTFNENSRRKENAMRTEIESFRNLKNLSKTVEDVNGISMDMAILSRNVRASSQSGQAISAAVAELVASTEQISTNSEHTAKNADEASNSVSEGLDAMQSVLEAMSNIAETSQQTESSLTDLMESSQQIGEFLTVIESISNQTNLLALNATIEAARAGEAGKGFAVVAAEVKELASLSNKAAEDISKRIHALNQGMGTIQGSISGSLEAIEQGQTLILGANNLMDELRTQVSEVSGNMQEVSNILHQQTEASHEIASSVAGVADLSTENEQTLAVMVKNLQESNDDFSSNAGKWFEANSDRSLCEMAKIDHILFKKKVVDTIMGRCQWKASEVPDHHACRLGKWYDGFDNNGMSALPVFKDLINPHEEVHAAAKQALECHAAGDLDGAFAGLKALDDASHEVLRALEKLSDVLAAEFEKSA
ncbi:methyl-accepting chemotaxis protein [Cohaesibacter celericrescens]|uniref:Methyl-accepting transducer domain-containing protein n=1 Tax=Cohaesibacter celericrescens TaxID=2067669 RepID=A0A2N5XNC9_9HYPH|nr:methyl-accepting chemotaxis protein [Cohaesibacter celericrescens]PLW76004.1 hypothetical protein C0081_18080 [Cohaesibacter celericrescens]